MNIKDVLELVFGTTFFLIILVGCVILANKITQFLTVNGDRNINLLLLSFHLIMIVVFVIVIRSLFFNNIKNKDILNGIFALTGPIIGLSSIYMGHTLHALIG